MQPNILIVICDDLGWRDLSAHGNPVTRTPNLDRLSRGGVSAQRHLSGPLCSPARACLMTGRYHYRSRVVDTYCGRSMMDPEVATLPEALRDAGYRTGCFGKWHLGDNCPFRPHERGFDEALWHGSGGIGQPGDHPDNYGRDSYFDPVLWHNGEAVKKPGYCTDVFTGAAIDFMSRPEPGPWFSYVAFNAPHTPLQVDPAKAAACSARGATGQLAAYYALVENIDENVGRLLAALELNGQADNTIVLFTSDHGPCPSVRAADGTIGYDAGLRGEKGSLYEGGIRVPALWRWPAALKKPLALTVPTHPIDVMPTLLAASGARPVAGLDGHDLMPSLRGREDTALRDRTLFLQWHRGDRPVRYRNCAAVAGPYKWTRPTEASPDELYDTDADPGETVNLAAEEPGRVGRMRAAYDVWFDSVGSGHGFAPLRIHIGDTREPETILSRQDWRVLGADGWSSQHKGQWHIDVVAGGNYEIAVEFDQSPPEPAAMTFHDGDRVHAVELKPGVRTVTLQAGWQKGPREIRAEWQTRFAFAYPFLLRVRLVS